jgi:perosamine synthetase
MPSINVPAARPTFSPEDRAEIAALIDQSITSGTLTLGPHTQAFESRFAARHQADHAVAVTSGTAALEIVFRAIGVEGAEVVVPSNTFFATAAGVVHAGGRVRLADVSPDTLALSAASVEAALTEDTKGVVMVHIGGMVSPEVEKIAALCAERGIWLVEDAAHAHGASLNGRAAGTFGVASTFSFYPTKVMTSGEGGMIVTDDPRIRDEAVIYRDQGKAGFLGGDHVRLGYAWRMSEVHAAIGLVQLGRLDEFIATRRRAAARYDAALASIPGITPVLAPAGSEPNYYKYMALLDPGIDRAEVKKRLREEHGVSMSGEVYASPLHRQPVFEGLPHGDLSVAEDVCARHVCLPVHNDMRDEETEAVIAALAAVLG